MHHEKESEEEAQQAGEPEKDPSPASAKDEQRHSLFRGQRKGMNRD